MSGMSVECKNTLVEIRTWYSVSFGWVLDIPLIKVKFAAIGAVFHN